MSFFHRTLFGAACLLAATVFLTSCANRHPAQTGQAPIVAASADEAKAPLHAPRRSVAPVALVPIRPQKSQPAAAIPPAPAPEVSKTEKIIRNVRQGTLVRESRDLLVFTRLQPSRPAQNSLYEDAITLARLRKQLKNVDGLPASVSASAIVRNATAYLKLDHELAAETSARAIDSALKTDDIGAVHAQLIGAARL